MLLRQFESFNLISHDNKDGCQAATHDSAARSRRGDGEFPANDEPQAAARKTHCGSLWLKIRLTMTTCQVSDH
eukprot:755656-Hanusia_phi.AAC.1